MAAGVHRPAWRARPADSPSSTCAMPPTGPSPRCSRPRRPPYRVVLRIRGARRRGYRLATTTCRHSRPTGRRRHPPADDPLLLGRCSCGRTRSPPPGSPSSPPGMAAAHPRRRRVPRCAAVRATRSARSGPAPLDDPDGARPRRARRGTASHLRARPRRIHPSRPHAEPGGVRSTAAVDERDAVTRGVPLWRAKISRNCETAILW